MYNMSQQIYETFNEIQIPPSHPKYLHQARLLKAAGVAKKVKGRTFILPFAFYCR